MIDGGREGSPAGETPYALWTYATAQRYLSAALRFGMHPSLAGIRALSQVMGRPQDAMSFVQVTGTNGKTSVTRMTAALLAAHGVPVGAYTSPHLVEYTERMELGGAQVSREQFARAMAAAAEAVDGVGRQQLETLGLLQESGNAFVDENGNAPAQAFTEFELLTAAALWLFRANEVQWACLEVGMGGRWDATSIVHPAVAVVSGVALDHTERLGGTMSAIAEDKAHVIKPGSVAVLGPGTADVNEILSRRAAEVGAPIINVARTGDEGLGAPDMSVANVRFDVIDRPRGLGRPLVFQVHGTRAAYGSLQMRAPVYQVSNAAVAIAAAEAALDRPLDPDSVQHALLSLTFPGRFEVVRLAPPLVLDGAHNPEAAAILGSAISDAFRADKPAALLAVLGDKDAEGIVRALAPHVRGFVCTRNESERCIPAAELAALVGRVTGERPPAEEDIEAALGLAERFAGDGGVVVTGSLYTVGAVKRLLAGRNVG